MDTIPIATAPVLMIKDVVAWHAGQYDVIVSNASARTAWPATIGNWQPANASPTGLLRALGVAFRE